MFASLTTVKLMESSSHLILVLVLGVVGGDLLEDLLVLGREILDEVLRLLRDQVCKSRHLVLLSDSVPVR